MTFYTCFKNTRTAAKKCTQIKWRPKCTRQKDRVRCWGWDGERREVLCDTLAFVTSQCELIISVAHCSDENNNNGWLLWGAGPGARGKAGSLRAHLLKVICCSNTSNPQSHISGLKGSYCAHFQILVFHPEVQWGSLAPLIIEKRDLGISRKQRIWPSFYSLL